MTLPIKLPAADDEYTPTQRRVLNARLAEAEKGPYFGPFKNGAEVAAFLKRRTARPGKSNAPLPVKKDFIKK